MMRFGPGTAPDFFLLGAFSGPRLGPWIAKTSEAPRALDRFPAFLDRKGPPATWGIAHWSGPGRRGSNDERFQSGI